MSHPILRTPPPQQGIRATTLAGLMILLATSASMTALASDVGSAKAAPTLTITYSIADLATEKGARNLYERIAAAARDVCPGYDSRELEIWAGSRTCQRKAIADAVRQIHNPRLAALLARHSPHG